jgi:hypothetical protein
MILSRVNDGIPLEVMNELNLKDTDELFWRKVVEQDNNSSQIYYIVSKNDLSTVPMKNIRRKLISKTDFITKSVQDEESFRDYENALNV